MKTAATKAIIYDDQCPMCVAYTSGFVKWGVLKKEHRVAFSTLHTTGYTAQIDPDRSRREIPLVDLKGGKTLYGVDALLFLLSQRIPLIKTVGEWKPVYWFVNRLYRLVSFNRRVIVGSRFVATQVDCAPVYNIKYRILFLVFAALVAIGVTALAGNALAGSFQIAGSVSVRNALLVCGAGWLFQAVTALLLLCGERRLEYLGQLAVLQIIGVFPLLLIPFGTTAGSRTVLAIIAVAVSAALMTWQHFRRMKNNDFSVGWTISWIVSLGGTAALLAAVLY
jgi:predicted DCC family thiol-disulfide oxidoreductase YuxK